MRETIFVHLSDLHVGLHGGLHGAGDASLLSDTRATLAAVVAEVNRLSPPPRFAAVSGDLAHRGDAESYRAVAAALAALPCPAVATLGNHDARAAHAEVFGGQVSGGEASGGRVSGAEPGPAFAERVLDGVHVVALDSAVPGRIGGAIDAEQFERLAAALERHPALPKLLVMHHPPAVAGEAGWHSLDADSAARLAAALRGRPVAAILCGHIHQDRVALWHGIPVVTVTGLHAAKDPLHGEGLRSVRGASFGLCRLGPSGFSVTFVQMPSDRAELELLPDALVRTFV